MTCVPTNNAKYCNETLLFYLRPKDDPRQLATVRMRSMYKTGLVIIMNVEGTMSSSVNQDGLVWLLIENVQM